MQSECQHVGHRDVNEPVYEEAEFYCCFLLTKRLNLTLQEALSHVRYLECAHNWNAVEAKFLYRLHIGHHSKHLVPKNEKKQIRENNNDEADLDCNFVVPLRHFDILFSDFLAHNCTYRRLQSKRYLEEEVSECQQDDQSRLLFDTKPAAHQHDELERPPLCPEHQGAWDPKLEVAAQILKCL